MLDRGLQLSPYHLYIATENKDYGILELYMSRGWDINANMSDDLPSVLM